LQVYITILTLKHNCEKKVRIR